MNNGWLESAEAWIAAQGDEGDWSRRHVLDAPMLSRVVACNPQDVIDIGCGEGRFCRLLREKGIAATGIEPVPALVAQAYNRDRSGTYIEASAEALPIPDASFDLAIAFLTLIDMDDYEAAIAEAYRVVRPGGRFLIANLQSFATAGGWRTSPVGERSFAVEGYLDPRARWLEWDGIRVRNWHRPLALYMAALLEVGFVLTYFAEPEPTGGAPEDIARFRHAPWLMMMEWQKPR